MELNEIKDIISDTVDLVRKDWKKQTPEYYDGYKYAIDMKDDIRVHSERGVKPTKLISKRSPNQTDEEFKYVLENYKQITHPVFVDLISTIQRAFNDNNWSIEYVQDDREDTLKDYLEEGLKNTPLQMSLESWIKSVVPPVKMTDAMGCIAVKPWFIPTVETEDGEVVSGERYEPVPYYYSCDQVVSYLENEYFLFLMKEKSDVYIGDQRVKEGLIFEFYDKEAIWIIRQVGKKDAFEFEYIEYVKVTSLSVTRLKGIPFMYEGRLMWASPFISVVDILDEAVLDACNLRSIKNKCVYPYRIMLADICDATYKTPEGEILRCDSGHYNDLAHERMIPCKTCAGTGRKSRVTPLGEMLILPKDAFSEGDTGFNQPPMSYVSPLIDTPQFLREEINKFLDQGRAILHLRTSASEVSGSEDMTATGKAIDQKSLYAFIKGISDQIFELYEFVIDKIGDQRYGEDYEKPSLTYPVNFDLKGEAEYLTEIGEAVKNGVPQIAVNALTNKYLESLFYNDGESSMAYEIIKEADRLLTMSDDDILMKSQRGIIAPYEVILHDSAFTFIKELIAETPTFLLADMDTKVQALIEKAKAKAAEVKPSSPATSVIDTILNRQV